jgi:hypothetical protein
VSDKLRETVAKYWPPSETVTIPRAQHEALMMAIRKLEFISNMEGSYHSAYATFSAAKHHAQEAVKIVRAAGIDMEEKA